jgi:TetR/AcrR family transcriptional regulator, transcriptional repressor for nem operon
MKSDTRETIIALADVLIREKGFNAFSFHDISKTIGIKTSSIHYYFPTKSDLCISIIQNQEKLLRKVIEDAEGKDPLVRLKRFIAVYSQMVTENKVCLVGSLCTDLNTVEEPVKKELLKVAENILMWVTAILKDGRDQKVFKFKTAPRTKALLVISNMMAMVQLCRLTGKSSFDTVKLALIKELTE